MRMTADETDLISVRYAELTPIRPYFSKSKMSVSEIYVALENGFLDPGSLAAITVFEVSGGLYCLDTRRLMIIQELQRRNKWHVLEGFRVQYVQEGDTDSSDQYWELADHRIPAMRKEGLDGSTIQIDYKSKCMCCFDQTGNFRANLDRHIAEKHLNMLLWDFKNLNTYDCHQCGQRAYIIAKKSQSHTHYTFYQKCGCRKSELWMLDTMQKPWATVTFTEFCNEFLRLKENLDGRYNDLHLMKKQLLDQIRDGKPPLAANSNQTEYVQHANYVMPFGILVLITMSLLAIFLITLNLIKLSS